MSIPPMGPQDPAPYSYLMFIGWEAWPRLLLPHL